MTITIKTDDKDASLLSGFALATGWNDRMGITVQQWLNDKMTLWVFSQAKLGYAINATISAKSQYLTSFRTASDQAKVAIPLPVVSSELVAP